MTDEAWVLGNQIGQGNTAEVFEYGTDRVCKLFIEGYPMAAVEKEYQNACELFQRNVSVPKPYALMKANNRNGIVYEKIEGQTMYRLYKDGIWSAQTLLEEFTKLHQRLLQCHGTNGISYKTFLTTLITEDTPKSAELWKSILTLPEGDCILHGDFHPDNILVKPDGTAVVIDFMNVCYGPALYDVARTCFLLSTVDQTMADAYCIKMNADQNELEAYLNVIRACRKYEAA